jgi:Rrf2 family protein
MAANSQFSVAIHIMTSLGYRPNEAQTSQYLAKSVCTNPVVIRRILSRLHKGGLVVAQSGKAGGARLAKPAWQITLADIYRATECGTLFAIPRKEENKACVVACHMKQLLCAIFSQTEEAIEKTLSKVTLASLLQEMDLASKKAS